MAEHELNKIVDDDGEVFNLRDSTKQPTADRVTAWGSTPSDTKYPSEKLVKTSLDGKASSTHTHGNMTNYGVITGSEAIANGDAIVVANASDSNKLAKTTVTFDGSTTTTALTPKGTFEAFAKASDITTAIQALDVSSAGGAGKYISAISETDGKISATATTMDTTPTANSTNAVTSGGIKTALDAKGPNAPSEVTIATGDKPLIADSSDSNKVKRASISFDTGVTNTMLRKDGTFAKALYADEGWGGTWGTALAPMDTYLLQQRNCFFGAKPSAIAVEYSTDGGSTWIDYGLNDDQKRNLFSQYAGTNVACGKHTHILPTYTGSIVGTKDLSNANVANQRLRITICCRSLATEGTTTQTDKWLYATIRRVGIYMSTNSAAKGPRHCVFTAKKREDFNAGNDTWINFGDYAISGDSGWNSIPCNNKATSSGITLGDSYSGQYAAFRFEVWSEGVNDSPAPSQTGNMIITKIVAFSELCWKNNSSNSNLANYGMPCSVNAASGNAHFPKGITSGVAIPVSSGGTGKTSVTAGNYLVGNGTNALTEKTPNTAANDLINALTTGEATPTGDDYYVAQFAGGGTTTKTYHRRPIKALWEYIKSQISSVLGLTVTSYGGNAATATKATQDSDGNAINTTYLKQLYQAEYGVSTFADIYAAITAKKTVYCKVPGASSGSYRMAFLAYTTSSSIEFQYYRSNSSGTGDSVFVYTVTNNNNTWTTVERAASSSVKGDAESSYRTGQVNLTPENLGISATTSSVTVGSTTFNKYTHPTTSGNKHVPSGGSSGQFLGWDSDGTAKWVSNPNSDTKVKATAKTDNVNYKILATASASPTSGNATEAVYDTDITLNPSTNTIAANISGNATTATTAAQVAWSAGTASTERPVGFANSGNSSAYSQGSNFNSEIVYDKDFTYKPSGSGNGGSSLTVTNPKSSSGNEAAVIAKADVAGSAVWLNSTATGGSHKRGLWAPASSVSGDSGKWIISNDYVNQSNNSGGWEFIGTSANARYAYHEYSPGGGTAYWIKIGRVYSSASSPSAGGALTAIISSGYNTTGDDLSAQIIRVAIRSKGKSTNGVTIVGDNVTLGLKSDVVGGDARFAVHTVTARTTSVNGVYDIYVERKGWQYVAVLELHNDDVERTYNSDTTKAISDTTNMTIFSPTLPYAGNSESAKELRIPYGSGSAYLQIGVSSSGSGSYLELGTNMADGVMVNYASNASTAAVGNLLAVANSAGTGVTSYYMRAIEHTSGGTTYIALTKNDGTSNVRVKSAENADVATNASNADTVDGFHIAVSGASSGTITFV